MNSLKQTSFLKHRFSARGLWLLFLVIAFPIHVWAFIMFFYDFDWIARRTIPWDAVSVGAYALVIALVESLAIFLAAVLLSFLLPRRWSETQRLVLIGSLAVLVSLWGILGQLYFVLDLSVPPVLMRVMAGNAHPFRIVYGAFLVVAVLSILLPVYGVMRSEKFTAGMRGIFERLALLTSFYLVLDVVGLFIVIGRNL